MGSDASPVLITCEHASNALPRTPRLSLAESKKILGSHKAYDRGAASTARLLSRALQAPYLEGRYSRLVIDLNRPETDPNVFSKWSSSLPEADRRRLIESIHRPYWAKAAQMISSAIELHDFALHLSIHSFTPRLRGQKREAHVGVLYDPSRPGEARIASRLLSRIRRSSRFVVARANYPYRGVEPGLTTSLRRVFGPKAYAGLEIELNQSLFRNPRSRALAAIIKALLEETRETTREWSEESFPTRTHRRSAR